MTRLTTFVALAALVVAVGCDDNSPSETTTESTSTATPTATATPATEGVASYLEQLATIDEQWQADVDAAFTGREYLRTGALPADFEPTTEALNNLLEAARANLEELTAATATAREDVAALDVPPAAEAVHAEYTSVLTEFEDSWSEGLGFIEADDPEGFLRFYVTFQAERQALEQRLEASRAERERLASES